MIADVNHLKTSLLDIKHNRVQQGLGLNFPEIDEHIRLKPFQGSFDIVVGHANTGKTTVVMYLMTAFTIKHGLKWLVFSSENSSQSIARKAIEFYIGLPIQQMSENRIDEALNWFNEHFKIIEVDKLYTARDLMAEAAQIKKEWDYDGFLIDPYNSLIKDKSLLRSVGSHEYDYQISTEMRLFAKENKVCIWLNCHAVTEALRRTHPKGHEYEGHPMPPSMADVEGGGKWGNRADQVYTIHRYTQHPTQWMVSEVHVRKVKEVESGGRPTSLDSPVCLRMNEGGVGFSYAGIDVLADHKNKLTSEVKPPQTLMF
jgi:archaellum biogenesis ATPase FlaH